VPEAGPWSFRLALTPKKQARALAEYAVDGLKMKRFAVCTRYGSRIESYDVVNEAVNPADGTLYETALSRALGGATTTLDHAFHTARASAPHAQLVYNDYMSWEPGNAAHRAGVLRLLEGFRARGVPVDALGVQSHIITQGPDTARIVGQLQPDWSRFLDAVTVMGYRLVITELDVKDNALPGDPAQRDAGVVAYLRAYMELMLSYPQLRDVLAWGMVDKYSWLQNQWLRQDKAPKRPTLYDDAYRPKPLREAVAQALRDAPAR
jgi:endo-1,4-beta-xylanase